MNNDELRKARQAPFVKYGKTPRLYRDVTITEKLDGTNSQLVFMNAPYGERHPDYVSSFLDEDGVPVFLYCGSRNRLITPGNGTDNYGFAGWAQENALDLFEALGVGRHYGEWYGLGIARGYDLPEKRWALFNPHRYAGINLPPRVETVPLVMQRNFGAIDFQSVLADLQASGSLASPGFMNPEGVIVRHSASKAIYKLLIGDDGTNNKVKDPSPEEMV